MLTLHVAQSRLDDGRHRVQLEVRGDGAPQVAVSEFRWDVDAVDGERVRWYLEDFLEYPLDPAPRIASGVEGRLTQLGRHLFDAVFSSRDAVKLWARIQEQLPRLRVEVASEIDEATTLPWELIRDPDTDTPIALQAASFVRVNFSPATPVRRAAPGGERLRVLLVICRPEREMDVPFRSVARHLVRLAESAPQALAVDVLRPATFAALAARLEAAAGTGEPYQVVHFDGHGSYLDLDTMAKNAEERRAGGGFSPHRYEWWSRVSPLRPGRHGYLLFEDPDTVDNRQYVDGPALGALLARTGVSVLVLNACRSAYAQAPTQPAAEGDAAAADVHSRVRAYGSLALEVSDAGVPGVVAMRYSVYVVTAAQFVADLYQALLGGQPLGAAVGVGRRQLAADPMRAIAFDPRPLQDWCVPVVYEALPVPLFEASADRQVKLAVPEAGQVAAGVVGLPRPEVGFFGRDETLLALDRAFDTQGVVLLHAYAGAGKTSTAAEFAAWYQATGGLSHPQLGAGPVLFSSLERHTTLPMLLNQLADAPVIDALLKANGVAWQALTDAQRRTVAVQLLRQVPLLWFWDNVEPVAGFPTGTPSAWTPAEQAELASFLHDLTCTKAKVLLTSRRNERAWLGNLPARVELPPMPMQEATQLTQALAGRHGHRITDVAAWRPLLGYAAGNPLTITVLVGQSLREHLTSREQIEAFVDRLRAGQTQMDDDRQQGRSQSLGASLAYGFTRAFTDTERQQLALLHLFQDTVTVDALIYMGHPELEVSVAALHGLTRRTGMALLDKAADTGLLTALGGGCYRIHPALPWYLTKLFTTTHGVQGSLAATRATHAYTTAIADLGGYCHKQYIDGHHRVVNALGAQEANLLHARALAPPPPPLARRDGLHAGPAQPLPAHRPAGAVGPAGRRAHPRPGPPRHRRPSPRPPGPLEHAHRLPGRPRHGGPGLGHRATATDRLRRVGPRPGHRCPRHQP